MTEYQLAFTGGCQLWGLFVFNPLIFRIETLNNCSPALVGLRYIQLCATTVILAMQIFQCVSGNSATVTTNDRNNIECGQLIGLRKVSEFYFYILTVKQ